MTAAGVATFIEVGSGRVLTGLIKRIAPDAEAIAVDDGGAIDGLRLALRPRPPRLAPEDSPSVRKPDYDRRVVVTGLGVVSPVGNDVKTVWDNLTHGVSGLGELTRSGRQPLRAQVGRRGEGLQRNRLDGPEARPANRVERRLRGRRGEGAGRLRSRDHRRQPRGGRRDLQLGAGGQADDRQLISLHERGPRTVAPTFIANALVDLTSGLIAIETGAIGHNMAVVSACATGTHSVGEAAEVIRRGLRRGHRRLDRGAVAGGRPRRLHEHAGMGSLGPESRPRPCRPFDLTRNGFVLGEGAGGLLLEDLELAKARGARIYAEVVGYGRRRTAGTWSSRSRAGSGRPGR